MLESNKENIINFNIQNLSNLCIMYLKEIEKFEEILNTLSISASEEMLEVAKLESYINFLYSRYDYIIVILIKKEAQYLSEKEMETLSFY